MAYEILAPLRSSNSFHVPAEYIPLYQITQLHMIIHKLAMACLKITADQIPEYLSALTLQHLAQQRKILEIGQHRQLNAILAESQKRLITALRRQLNSVALVKELDHLIELTDQILARCTQNQVITLEIQNLWNKQVMLFQTQFVMAQHEKELKDVCKEAYAQIMRQAEILALYESWQNAFTREKQTLTQTYPNRDSLRAAFKIYDLLTTKKTAFFTAFFSVAEPEKHAQNLAYTLLKERRIEAASGLREAIQQKTRETRRDILDKERALTRPIRWQNRLGATLLRVGMSNLYTKTADHLVEAQERATRSPQFRKIPVFRTRLSPFFLTISKIVTAAGLLILDLCIWRWLELSQSLLKSIGYYLCPSLTHALPLARRLGFDEKQIVTYFYIFQEINLFLIYLGLCRYVERENSTMEIGVRYWAIIKMPHWIVTWIIKRLYRPIEGKKRETEDASTLPLILLLTQWGTFFLSMNYLWPKVVVRWYAQYPQELLQDNNCLRLGKKCHEAACHSLGVPLEAPKAEIHRAYRHLSSIFHPDRPTGNPEKFKLFASLRELCLKGKT